jgi:putative colanic acid biosynthesis acetyltransferase WcaF
MQQTDLSLYQNTGYDPGGSFLKRVIWFFVNALIFKTSLVPVNRIKVGVLRLFGAKIAKGVIIKPCVNIKYPWNLTIGTNTWIGENVWIDSLVQVTIGANVCISHGAVLLTGSHNYKAMAFNLITNPVVIADGVWICAGAIVNHGVTAASHAVLTAGSVANANLAAYTVYQGNPASAVRVRNIS